MYTLLLLCLGMVALEINPITTDPITNERFLTSNPALSSHQVPPFPAVLYGSWKFVHGKKQHKCCSWDTNFKPELTVYNSLCRDISHDNDQTLAPGQTAMAGGRWCGCSSYYTNIGSEDATAPRGDWIWERKSGFESLTWNPALFCQLLGPKRELYIIGDSTMQQSHAVLVNALIDREGGDCHKQIKFLLSDYLAPVTEDMKERGHSLEFYLHDWIKSNSTKEAILIINVGAHVNLLNEYREHLSSVSKFLTKNLTLFTHGGRLAAYWKTNNPPYTDCNVSFFTSCRLVEGHSHQEIFTDLFICITMFVRN